MLKISEDNRNVITNIREIRKVDSINFVYEDGGQLFSSNLKDVVLKILKES